MAEMIWAAFDTEQHADAAVRDLEAQGIASSAIRRFRPGDADAPTLGTGIGGTTARTTDETMTSEPPRRGSWLSRLFGEEDEYAHPAYEDRDLWHEHADAGRHVISITARDNSQAAEITRLLGKHMPEELESHPATDKGTATGLGTATGTSTTGTTTTTDARLSGVNQPVGMTAMSDVERDRVERERLAEANHSVGTTATTGTAVGEGVAAATGREEVIPLAEEQLRVGKRQETRTRRIRTYVVETPVEEKIRLREERIVIDRRAATGTDTVPANAFEEREVVVHETREVPQVEKTARVTGEVVVHREGTEREETVRDTVRRMEVDETGSTGETLRERAEDAVESRRGPGHETLGQRASDVVERHEENKELRREERAERRAEGTGAVHPPGATETEAERVKRERLERERGIDPATPQAGGI